MFAQRLRQLRESNNHTLDSLAELLGVSKQQAWRWEQGKNDPSGKAVTNIAKHFGVTADWLLGLVDLPHQMLAEEELSPAERRVLLAIRAGMTLEAIEEVIALGRDVSKAT